MFFSFCLFLFPNFKEDNLDSVCVCVFVCVSLTNDSSETVEVIIINLGTVAASDMRLHHVLIILTLTLIQGHTDQNHENNKCLIIQKLNAHQVCCEDSLT